MLRKCLFAVVAVIAVAVAGCGGGPMEPMPGGDDMMLVPTAGVAADSVAG